MTILNAILVKRLAKLLNGDESIISNQLTTKYVDLANLFFVFDKDIISVILDKICELLLEEMKIAINIQINKIHDSFSIEFPHTKSTSKSYRFVYYKCSTYCNRIFNHLPICYKAFYLNKLESFHKKATAPTSGTTVYREFIMEDECKLIVQCRTSLMPHQSLFNLKKNDYVDLIISE